MKQALILSFLFIAPCMSYGQYSDIVATSYKQVFKTNGQWEAWPDNWTSYESEGQSDPIIRITTISEGNSGDVYRLQFFVDGKVEADFNVQYDPQKSEELRNEWNQEYVNCYMDENGDYVYTEEVSLESLARDNTAWSENEDSKLYLMIYSEDFCVVVR